MDTCKLTDVKIYKDEEGYYLRLEYEKEDDLKISKMVIPKARLPLYDKPDFVDVSYCLSRATKAEIGDGIILKLDKAAPPAKIGKAVLCVPCWEQLIRGKKPTKEMTIEEIEKALGHKVKIVGDKDKDKDNEKGCSTCKLYTTHTFKDVPCSKCRHNLNAISNGISYWEPEEK